MVCGFGHFFLVHILGLDLASRYGDLQQMSLRNVSGLSGVFGIGFLRCRLWEHQKSKPWEWLVLMLSLSGGASVHPHRLRLL